MRGVILIIKAAMWFLAVLLIIGGVVGFALASEAGDDGLALWLSLAIVVFGPPLVCGPVYLLCRIVEALEAR